MFRGSLEKQLCGILMNHEHNGVILLWMTWCVII